MSNQTLSTKIFLRNDTESNWSSQNPVLGKGEIGIAIDKQYFKIGDGTNMWSAIKDLYPITKIDTELNIKNSSNAVFGQIALSSDTGILAYGKGNGTFEIIAKNADLQALSGRVDIIASSGGEPNQNAYSNVKVGSVNIPATTTTDTVEFVAGNNITITPDASTKKVTISSSDSYVLPVATSSTLGGVKSGNDISIDTSGIVTVLDNSHNHAIANVTGLQSSLDGKVGSVVTGTSNGTISVDGTNVAIKGLGTAAYTNSTAYDAFGSASSALTESKSYTDASVSTLKGSASDANTSITVYGVKNYAKNYADSILSANDAMVFKGTIGTGGTITVLPTSGYSAGWTYKVITAGTYAGQKCEVGDMIVAVKDFATTTANSDWTVIQTNIDGAVIGPTSSTSGNVALFDDSTGKLIKNSTIVGDNILQSTDTFVFDCGKA